MPNVFEDYGHLRICGSLFISLTMALQQNYLFGTYLKATLGTLEVHHKQMDLCEHESQRRGLGSSQYFSLPSTM